MMQSDIIPFDNSFSHFWPRVKPETWEMFSEEGNRHVTEAVRVWGEMLEDQRLAPKDVIHRLDEILSEDVEKAGHTEIHDTEPREKLAHVCKQILDMYGYSPKLTFRSKYAHSIWD